MYLKWLCGIFSAGAEPREQSFRIVNSHIDCCKKFPTQKGDYQVLNAGHKACSVLTVAQKVGCPDYAIVQCASVLQHC